MICQFQNCVVSHLQKILLLAFLDIEIFKHLDEVYICKLWCTIWDDVRTYLTSQIDPNEKTALLIAISHFKKEVKQ